MADKDRLPLAGGVLIPEAQMSQPWGWVVTGSGCPWVCLCACTCWSFCFSPGIEAARSPQQLWMPSCGLPKSSALWAKWRIPILYKITESQVSCLIKGQIVHSSLRGPTEKYGEQERTSVHKVFVLLQTLQTLTFKSHTIFTHHKILLKTGPKRCRPWLADLCFKKIEQCHHGTKIQSLPKWWYG